MGCRKMGKYILKYPHKNIQTARMLRKNMTETERILWSRLRSHRLGVKFRRQVAFGSYIADFVSIESHIIIELDGSQHYLEEGIQKDLERNQYFRNEGFTVLRFTNTDIMKNIDGALTSILEKIKIEQDK
jgi:very-short-patch-repair endonuclease